MFESESIHSLFPCKGFALYNETWDQLLENKWHFHLFDTQPATPAQMFRYEEGSSSNEEF